MFESKVDKRSRAKMVGFLENHFRYDTMNSWNASTSFANNVKVHRLNIPSEIQDTAYEMIYQDDVSFVTEKIIRSFAEKYNYNYQIGVNGRSGGYLVLYRGGRKQSEYKSYCPDCGQRNYKRVPSSGDTPKDNLCLLIVTHLSWRNEVIYKEYKNAFESLFLNEDASMKLIEDLRYDVRVHGEYTSDSRCGRCGSMNRRNYTTPIYETFTYPGQSVGNDDFEDLSMYELREMVELVCDFDRTCDEIVEAFIALCKDCEVVKEEVMVLQTRKVVQQRA